MPDFAETLNKIKIDNSISGKTKKVLTRLNKEAMSDKEYNEIMRRTRGGKDCVGCDD